MSFVLTVIAGFAGMLGVGALAGLLWLARALRWSTIEDEQLEAMLPYATRKRGWFARRSATSHGLLTYRRDSLGRFRRYRR